jgi:hypothetical protein
VTLCYIAPRNFLLQCRKIKLFFNINRIQRMKVFVMRAFLMSIFFVLSIVYGQHSFKPSVDERRSAMPFLSRDVRPDSMVQVIVEFSEEPMYIRQQRGNAPVSSSAPYLQRFVEFKEAIQSIASQVNSTSVRQEPNVHREFYRSFFGVSVSMPYGLVDAVASLPYVKKVHVNKSMKSSLHKSIPQIRANEVWNTHGAVGDGVVVGIIDTGIDYMHPALGGGFGSGAKVIGGYDFVNNDADPMDDNGHGTHVAGIVAADGAAIKGVAPKAKLYAFKVLGANGGGREDDIIAAIERTVDPNNDGNINDRLDIVNMSLGSDDGDPDDAASAAVDNATKLGVTFVIAAGNSGEPDHISGKEGNYFYSGMETIGSPGTSRLAITVGAVDSVQSLAYFSSKGPVSRTYEIKPDVVAPGVNIRSLFPGNGYQIESGTSMASPMIAGVAALLRSKDPSLTPAQIKSKIVNSSIDMGLSAMLQGAGRADAMRAFELSTIAAPAVLSFGMDDASQAVWTQTETVQVVNRRDVMQNYSISFTGGKTGIVLSSVPENFSLSSGAAQTLLITTAVNNAVIPIINEDIILHGGTMKVIGSKDTLSLPWNFARATKMRLTFSHPDPYFVGSSENSYMTPRYEKRFSRVQWLDPKTVEITGAPIESFDFAVFYPSISKLVLKGGVPFNGVQTFSFDASDAVHKIHLDGKDNNNVPFSGAGHVKRSVRVNLPSGSVFAQLQHGSNVLSVSPAGAQFEFHPIESLIDLNGEKRVVLPQYPSFSGISSDRHVTTTASEYIHQKLRFTMPEGVSRTRMFTEVISSERYSGEYYFNAAQIGIDTLDVPHGATEFDLYLMKEKDPKYSTSIAFHTNSSYQDNYNLDMSTRYLSVVNDSVMMGLPSQELMTTVKSPAGAMLHFGSAPIYVSNLSYNNSFGTSIHFSPFFHGSLFEQRFSDINHGTYSIFDDAGTLLKTNPLNDYPRFPFEAELKRYTLVLSSNGYSVKNAKGTLTLRNEFDLSKPVPDAPIITSFQIRNGSGNVTGTLTHGEQARLIFSSKVLAFPSELPVIDSTKVYYRRYKTSQWILLASVHAGGNAQKEGAITTASLSPATAVDSTAIDLKIRVVDQYGNSAEQILSPAFSVGNWMDDGSTDVPDGETSVPLKFALHQNFPNPFNPVTTIQYSVPATGHVRLSVYDMLGREVSVLVNGIVSAGDHSETFTASHLASGMYLYRLSAGTAASVKKMVVVK